MLSPPRRRIVSTNPTLDNTLCVLQAVILSLSVVVSQNEYKKEKSNNKILFSGSEPLQSSNCIKQGPLNKKARYQRPIGRQWSIRPNRTEINYKCIGTKQ